MSSAQLQSYNSKNTASGSNIQHLGVFCHKFLQLTNYQLGCLVHTSSKSCTWINVKDHLIFIFFLHFFPGWNNKNVIYIELMEIFLPVIDPVFVLCLGFCDGAFADIHVSAYFFKDSTYSLENRRSFCVLFQIKIQIGDSIICWTFRHNIHKHLLFICLGKRLFVLNLYALNSNICKGRDDNVFCFCFCFDGKAIPLHTISPIFLLKAVSS